ncbi:DUF86 domain-containing protein [Paenibacillus marinisediminis]
MYYVDRQQIDNRLQQIKILNEAVEQITAGWNDSALFHMAQERSLHLAVEIVTDVGSLLIDGFIMRDASSYEDIIEIIAQEGVLDEGLQHKLLQLVQLRKPLVQQYAEWERTGIHSQLSELPELLTSFKDCVERYIESELLS